MVQLSPFLCAKFQKISWKEIACGAFCSTNQKKFDKMSDESVSDETIHLNQQRIQEKIEEVGKQRISNSTRKNYSRYLKRFVDWLLENSYGYVVEENSILIDLLTAHMINSFFIELTESPKQYGMGTFQNYRSALMMLYTDQATEPPSELGKSISNVLGGIKRSIASERQNGIRKSKEGKQPFSFELYNAICEQFLIEGNLFGLAYTTFSWNLACRTNNADKMNLSHMSYSQDALQVVLPLTKTN
jgi:hypothetical protein